MGILYTVWPLDDQAKTWLWSQDIGFPESTSRWPTRAEVERVLGELRGFKVKFTLNGPGNRWDADIDDGEEDGNRTLLHAVPQDNDDGCTLISFEKGEPTLIVAILRALATTSGPFMLLPDVGCPPMVIAPSRSIPEIVGHFCTIDLHSEKWQRLVRNAPGAAPVQ
jgi:hypothetical protein